MNSQQKLRFLCGMCTYSTADDKAFLSHYGDQHKREMAYWCRECGRTFASPAQLVAHIKSSCTKIKSVVMRCGVTNCSFSGTDPFQFMQHIKIVHKGTHLFPCFKCRKLFTIASCLIQHIQTECAEADSNKGSPSPYTEVTTVGNHSATQKSRKPDNVVPRTPCFGVETFDAVKKSEKRKIFECVDEESDPDDPTWKPCDPEKRICPSVDLARPKDVENESRAKHPMADEAKKKNDEQQIVPLRYERWNDWWKAVSACKSPDALESLLREESLRHFFTCMGHSCRFSTDDETAFASHQSWDHPGQKLPCRYCLREIEAGSAMAEHSVSAHGTRRHQCSLCLYRASTKSQVALHFEAMHGSKPIIFGCEPVGPESEVAENAETEVAMPYICRVGRCKYETCNPEEFVVHNRQLHTGVSVYPCFYCGTETFKLDALMRHYRLHGIYNFQCAHCVHGTNTIEEILFHQCLNHAERRMQVYVRPSSLPKTASDDALETDERPPCNNSSSEALYPDFFRDCAINFRCGVEGCRHILCGLQSYEEHLLASHHCNSFFPCPHCTAISVTSVDLEGHLTMHGPNMYACGSKDCVFFHWNRGSVETHCRETHREVTVVKVIREEDVRRDIKKEPEETDLLEQPAVVKCEVADRQDSRIDFRLQLSGSISVGEIRNSHPLDEAISSATKIPYVCPFCEYASVTQDAIREHLCRELEYAPYRCDLCDGDDGKQFSRSKVQKHIDDRHPNAIGTNAYSEFTDGSVDSWIATYLGTGPPGNIRRRSTSAGCCFCTTQALPYENLKRHLAEHLRYKPHSCVFCNQSFFGREEARTHVLTSHGNSEGSFATHSPIARIEKWLAENAPGKTYRCYYCNFGPCDLRGQREHFSKVHADKKLRLKRYPTPKMFTCEKCGHVTNLSSRSSVEKRISCGKKLPPLDLSCVWVSSASVKIPVCDLMKIINFNANVVVRDLKRSLFKRT